MENYEQEFKAIDEALKNSNNPKLKKVNFSALSDTQKLNLLDLVQKICFYYAAAKSAIDFITGKIIFWWPRAKKAINNVTTAIEEACAIFNP